MSTPENPNVDMTVESMLPADPGATFSPGKAGTEQGTSAAAATMLDSMAAAGVVRTTVIRDSKPSKDGDAHVHAGRDYILHRMIGLGGFGEVWEASQIVLGRSVAVKRLRTDLRERLATNSEAARAYAIGFHQEALTAASLDHPNIVPIYDLGIDEDGFPLLAMKLVRGKEWDAMIAEDFDAMPVGDFLAKHIPILVSVTQAMAFAHAHGVLHRDIKPSQVMVGEFGEVFLMDWGLAIPFDTGETDPPGDDGEAKAVSEGSNPAGTTAYMAPEQTLSHPRALGPWTDIFLLGGTLYFLLTGRNPHDGITPKEVYFRAAYKRVEEPEDRRPDREMPSELVSLCMSALERKPAARIATARRFARALQDFLSGSGRQREADAIMERVEARMGSRKLTYNEFADSISQLARAAALAPDNVRLETLRDNVGERYARAAIAKGDLGLARVQAHQVGDLPARESLMADINKEQERLRVQRRQRHFALGAVAVLMGITLMGGILFTRELGRERDAAEAARRRAEVVRDSAEGLASFLISGFADRLDSIGRVEILTETGDEILRYFRSVPTGSRGPETDLHQASALQRLGQAYRASGRTAEAVPLLEESVAITTRLRGELPDSVDVLVAHSEGLVGLGNALRATGNAERGAETLREALETIRIAMKSPRRPPALAQGLFTALDQWGLAQEKEGDTDGALATYDEAIAHCREQVASLPKPGGWRRDLAVSLSRKSNILEKRGRTLEALNLMEEARDLDRAWSEEVPSDLRAMRELSTAIGRIGGLLLRLDRKEEAKAAFLEELELAESISRSDPANASWKSDLASVTMSLGVYFLSEGDRTEARRLLERGLDILQGLHRQSPTDEDLLAKLASANGRLASLLDQANEYEEARKLYRKDFDISELLLKRTPDSTNRRIRRATSALALAGIEHTLGNTSEALALAREAVPALEAASKADATNVKVRQDTAAYANRLGGMEYDAGELEASRTTYIHAVELFSHEVAASPENTRMRESLAVTRARLGRVEFDLGRIPIAKEHAEFALLTFDELAKGSASLRLATRRAAAGILAGDIELAMDRPDAARAHWERTLGWIDALAEPGASDATALEQKVAALARLDRRDEAGAIARGLLEKGYREPSFLRTCRQAGIATNATTP